MFNEAIKVIKSRRSVRKYIDKEIPEEVLREIVDCARLAPSGNNRQPWAFLVITDQDKKEKIASLARYGKFIKEAGACIGVFIDESQTSTPLLDAAAATENIILAATALGLGTCWVSSYKRDHSEEVKKMVNCPPDMELVALISVGYYDEMTVGMPKKKELEEVLHWNSF
ncbi:MAG: nitroreductase family protein [Halanaerobiaceae bacterium]|nr:nitroreductase family protein [Halanaerobiaceae bacterium]